MCEILLILATVITFFMGWYAYRIEKALKQTEELLRKLESGDVKKPDGGDMK